MTAQIRALASLNSAVPLAEIEFEPDVRYVFLDEDGKLVSSVFYDFASALTWFQRWDMRKRSIQRRREQYAQGRAIADWQAEQLEKEENNLTRTGKPPRELRRVVLLAHTEDPGEAEQQIIKQLPPPGGSS